MQSQITNYKSQVARRLAFLLVGLAMGSAIYWWWPGGGFILAPRAERNVLLITIDTLRGDALGSYGGRAATPNLDRLAAGGARFTFAHAQTVLTLPSHASILTGRYPYEHGIRDNNGYRLRADEPTLATRLKSLGFATGAFISAFVLDQRYGLQRGFDVYDDRVSEVGRVMAVEVPERRADVTVGAAVNWIGQQKDKWFGWVHVFDPHAPYAPPAEWLTRYATDTYAGEVAWTDAALAPLLNLLAAQPRPTLVIVTADHGESLGEHGEMTHGVFAYEATLHVPLIVAEIAPGAAAPRGRVIDTPARHVDLVPTVLDAVGAPAAANVAGTSLLPAISGADHADRPSYFEAMMPVLARGWAPLRGVVVNRDKLIDLPIRELYELGADAKELRNLAASQAARVEVLTKVLATFNLDAPNRPAEETAAARERLRALGYAGGSPVMARERYTDADDPKRLIELDKRLHRASEAYLAGKPAEAAAIYQDLIKQRPDLADAYRSLAFMLWQAGQRDLAIATLEMAIKNGVTQRDMYVKLGLYLAETGQSAKAIALLTTLPQDDTEALNALGIAFGHARRSADAMRMFTRAIELDSTNGLAHQNIGTLQLQANDLKNAETSLRRALSIDPTLAGAHTSLGVVLAQTGRAAEAIDEWKRAVDLDPTDFDGLFNLTLELVKQGRMDEARNYGGKYLATAPPSVYGQDLARVRQMLGR